MFLTSQDVNLKHVLNERLAELVREELKWYHRVGMKTDRIQTDITDIVFVFIFVFEYGVRYG